MAVPIVLGSVFTQVYMLTNLRLASRLRRIRGSPQFRRPVKAVPVGLFRHGGYDRNFPTLSGMWSKATGKGSSRPR